MAEAIKIVTELRDGVNIVRIRNVALLDPAQADEMTKTLLKAFEGGDQKVLIDIGSVSRMSSLFFRSFIIAGKKAKEKRAVMAFCNVSPTIKGGFEMMGLTSYFTIYDRETSAVADMG